MKIKIYMVCVGLFFSSLSFDFAHAQKIQKSKRAHYKAPLNGDKQSGTIDFDMTKKNDWIIIDHIYPGLCGKLFVKDPKLPLNAELEKKLKALTTSSQQTVSGFPKQDPILYFITGFSSQDLTRHYEPSCLSSIVLISPDSLQEELRILFDLLFEESDGLDDFEFNMLNAISSIIRKAGQVMGDESLTSESLKQ